MNPEILAFTDPTMGLVPDCLKRRYEALDEVINELSLVVSNSATSPNGIEPDINEPGIKLMCQFWNILKEDPNCDLKKVVLDKMETSISHSNLGNRNYSCFMAVDDKQGCTHRSTPASPTPSCAPSTGGDVLLSKVLCNLKEAATYDKQCCEKISDLKKIQHQLLDQIRQLEARETAGVKLLKKADCMWACMEETYKKKIEESIESQKEHLKEQRSFEQSQSKWRKHKKDLEFQVKNLDKCRNEIRQKINEKSNDLKFIKSEIADLQKKVEANENDAEALNQSLSSRQRVSNERRLALAEKLRNLQKDVEVEKQKKNEKEEEGKKCIKQAREDLQKICTRLLQKRMENEDLKAERDAIVSEIELLKVTADQCKDRCKNRQEALNEELAQVNEDIAMFRLKCTKCHKCVDTNDVRRFCMDCPKCEEERDCIYTDDSCQENPDNDCVCMVTKRRFLDNVFENMYNVLASQIKTKNGKALAEQIFDCLKRSRNGKLTNPARKAVQEFVLATVKKNLNLTIIGGAVKTRCEMDSQMYDQLMLCLNNVVVEKPPKEDKGTVSKKEPCKRWGAGECNCPNGPQTCICTNRAAPMPKDPQPCPHLEEDKLDIGEAKKCPKREEVECGPDCANPRKPSKEVEKIAGSYHPSSCVGESCTFSRNVRAAQCDPESPQPQGTQPPSVTVKSSKRNSRPRSGEETYSFTKNMRAAQCTLGPSTTKGYVDKEFVSPLPPKKYLTKGPSVDGKMNSNAHSDSLQSYSSVNNNGCDCKPTKPTKGTISRTCHTALITALISNKSSLIEFKDQIADVGTHVCSKRLDSKDGSDNYSDLIEVNLMPSKYKDVPRVQAEVLSGAHVDHGTEPLTCITDQERIALEQVVSNLTKPFISKQHLKVVIPKDKGEVEHEYTEITATSSGSMVMALNEKMIEKIRNMTEKDQILLGVLRKTFSGHYALEFDRIGASSAVSRQVVVKKKDSGNIVMEVHKDIIETIHHPGAIRSKNTKGLSKTSSISMGLTKRKGEPCQHKCFETDHVQAEYKIRVTEKKGKYNIMRRVSMDQYDKCNDTLHSQQKNLTFVNKASTERIKNNFVILNRVPEQQLGQSYNINNNKQFATKPNSVITKTHSSNYTGQFNLQDKFQKMIEMGFTSLDLTVVGGNGVESVIRAEITMTQSRHIAVNVNAIESLGDIANRLKDYPVSFVETKSRYLLNLGRTDDNANAILRRNSTGGILVVLKDPILKCPGIIPEVLQKKKAVCIARVKGVELDYCDEPSLFLRETSSGNFEFVLDKEFQHKYMETINKFNVDECVVNLSKTESEVYIIDLTSCETGRNGLLVKSRSGNMKIFAVSNFDNEKLQMYRSSCQNDVLETLQDLPSPSSEFHREHETKSKHLHTKSCSDTLLYGKLKKCDQNILQSDTAVILKKTDSGKYAIVLNKESDVSFINNIKNFMSNSGNCLIPIKITKGGDLVICLCQDHDGLYGSVKITPSGNIGVVIDQNLIKDIEKRTVEVALSGPSLASVHFIGSLVDPCDKRVTTSTFMPSDYLYDEPNSPDSNNIYKTAVQTPTEYVSQNALDSEEGFSSDVSAHIGILRSAHPKLNSRSMFREQSYYVIEPPSHYKKFNLSSKELTAKDNSPIIKQFCFEMDRANHDKETYRADLSRLDYLDSMPPQLPSFLRDIYYK